MGALWGGLAFSMEDDFLFPTVMGCGRDSYTGLLSSLPRTLSMAIRPVKGLLGEVARGTLQFLHCYLQVRVDATGAGSGTREPKGDPTASRR